MKTIPQIDLTRQHDAIAAQMEAAVSQVIRSGRYIGGDAIAEFASQFAATVGTRECITCNSGTDALYLALRALDIGEGDEVITTPFTFAATTEPIILVGATPVFVDIDASFNLDLGQVEAAITPKTKAILPVHLFGAPVEMGELVAIARRHHLYIVEDCAQATGAKWGDRPVGSFGDLGCFSFFPTKNLGACGDGGAVTTNDPKLARRVRMLANHGQTSRYYYEATGINSRLDALQGALLLVKLPYLDRWNQQRRQLALAYEQLLQPLPVVLPSDNPKAYHVWNQYTIRVPQRDRVRDRLQERGIATGIYYPKPLHLQPVYRHLGYEVGQFPVAEAIAHEVLSLPLFPGLSFPEQERVVYALKDACVG